MQPNHQLLILAQVLIPMLLFGFCCNHTCSQDSRLWNYKSGMWLIKDNVSVIPPLQLGKEFKVNFGLHLYRCESSLKKCPVPASSIRGFYKDDQNQSIFSVTQIKVNPSTSYMVQDQEQYFTASFLGDPKQIMPDKDYLMHLSLEDDNDDSKVQSIGFHKFEKSTGNDDDPGGEEVDIAGTLFNFFNQQYAAIKQENSKILGKYSDKQALEFSKKFVNQKIQRLRKANAKCKSYRFAIAKIIKDLNQDHYGDDIIYVKFYRDEEFVYERNTGETKQEHAVGTPFSATLERYREDGTDRWKVTSIELFIDSFSDQSMPTATQIKKNIKGLEYPKWAYYNGPGIREHIDKYWDSYDPSFHNYLGYGGDCTNVSRWG